MFGRVRIPEDSQSLGWFSARVFSSLRGSGGFGVLCRDFSTFFVSVLLVRVGSWFIVGCLRRLGVCRHVVRWLVGRTARIAGDVWEGSNPGEPASSRLVFCPGVFLTPGVCVGWVCVAVWFGG